MLRALHVLILTFLLSICTPFAAAQDAGQDAASVDGSGRLPDVYIDCESFLCDFDYFRTEMPFVNYVRNRQDADVHVLVTTERTGGGGRAFTLTFLGMRQFEALDDTLGYTSNATATDNEVREGLIQVLRAGIIRYISRTPLLDRFDISYAAPENGGTQVQASDDPWNYWVFSTRLTAFANGEDRYQNINLYGSASASRVTEDLKLRFSLNGSRRSQHFELSDGSETLDVQESYGASSLSVWSLNPHWSAGGRTGMSRSSRLNIDLNATFAPAIEYNVYPYSESTRKLLTFQYSAGWSYFDYGDTTLFDVVTETRLQHTLQSVVSARQPWGTVSVSLNGSQYFFDLSKFNLSLGGNVDLRLFRGFSVDLGGNVSFVRDQLYLPKGDASNEDVLLRRRELETNWRYFFRAGISYTFGSKFNNVVNPRFGSGSGNVIFF